MLNLGGADITGGQLLFNYTGGSDPASMIAQAVRYLRYTTATGERVSLTNDNVNDNVILALVAALFPGDANLDGTVNGADLNTVLSNYNQSGMAWSQGDFNYDGVVNGADLNTVLSNYNQVASVAPPCPSRRLCCWRPRAWPLCWPTPGGSESKACPPTACAEGWDGNSIRRPIVFVLTGKTI